MATQSTRYPLLPSGQTFSWSGIFAGTLLYLGIEATFGMLGLAIFAPAMNRAGHPLGLGIGAGAGIWMVILSIIALYFAGNLAAKLSGATTRNLGMYVGLVTFGMCVFASVLTGALMLGNTIVTTTAYANPVRVADLLAIRGYWFFIALVLAMISAASGGIHGVLQGGESRPSLEQTKETRRVA